MATARKVGKNQLKILCDCKRKHMITFDGDGEMEIETFNFVEENPKPKDEEPKDGKTQKGTFDISDFFK